MPTLFVRPSFQSLTESPASDFKDLVVFADERGIGSLERGHHVMDPVYE